jgi:hypothetical protein
MKIEEEGEGEVGNNVDALLLTLRFFRSYCTKRQASYKTAKSRTKLKAKELCDRSKTTLATNCGAKHAEDKYMKKMMIIISK